MLNETATPGMVIVACYPGTAETFPVLLQKGPAQMMQPRDFSPAELLVSEIGPGTVRLSIGLEDPLDLQTDLSRSLELAAR